MRTRPTLSLCFALGLLLLGGGCQKSDQGSKAKPAESIAEAASPQEAFGRLTVDELVAKMAEAKAGTLKLAVFDNNGRDTFNQGHLPGATWVQYDEIKPSDLPTDKDTQLVFYCYNEH